jgi:hypothetical protein
MVLVTERKERDWIEVSKSKSVVMACNEMQIKLVKSSNEVTPLSYNFCYLTLY